MPTVIAIVAYLCIGLHAYLNYFWIKQLLPYPFGFAVFVKIEGVLILLNAIYLLGWLWGTVVFLITILGAGVAVSFPITLLCHLLTDPGEMQKMVLGERPSPILFGGWSLLVLVLGALTVVNLCVTPFRAGLRLLTSFVGSSSTSTLAWIGAICCLLVYLLIGLAVVAKDFAGPLAERPLYTMGRSFTIALFNIFLWPVSLIARKAVDRSLRRRDR